MIDTDKASLTEKPKSRWLTVFFVENFKVLFFLCDLPKFIGLPILGLIALLVQIIGLTFQSIRVSPHHGPTSSSFTPIPFRCSSEVALKRGQAGWAG